MPLSFENNVVTVYTIEWTNVEGAEMSINIHDSLHQKQETFPDVVLNYVPLQGGTDPLILGYNNSGERLDNPIMGRYARMTFQNTTNEFLSLFSGGYDNRFYVTISNGHTTVFEGFTVMEDNSEPYVPPGALVTLTATDNLGLLKGKELTKIDGTKFRNENKIIDYVVACLRNTNLSLQVNVINNLYEDSHQTRDEEDSACAWYQTYLNALTFEKDINEAEDCYTVLEKILFSWGMRISQYKSKWWIVRMDEMKNSVVSYSTYDVDGVLLNDGTINASLLVEMGHANSYDVFFRSEETIVREQRQREHAIKEVPFTYPKEIPCNIDFERGTVTLDTPTEKRYTPECLTLYRGLGDSSTTPNATMYFKKTFDENGYELERYLVITEATATGAPINFAQTEEIEVHIKDKISFSVSFRWVTDLNAMFGGTIQLFMFHIRLEADDGTNWTLDQDGKWYQSNAGWSTFFKAFIDSFDVNVVDGTEWRDMSVDSEPIPRTGKIYIALYGMNQLGTVGIDVYYQNMQFTYHPFINGSYKKYDAEEYKVLQVGEYSANENDKLLLFDSQKKLFQGSMLIKSNEIFSGNTTFDASVNTFSVLGDQTAIFTPSLVVRVSGTDNNNTSFTVVSRTFTAGQTNVVVTGSMVSEFHAATFETTGTNYNLTNRWKDFSIDPNGLGWERFAKWQLYWVWNQVRTEKRIFDMALKGLNSNTANYCDVVHKYYNNVFSLHNRNKHFLILHCEQNWYTCQWTATMIEIDDVEDSRTYADTFTFKYIAK